MNTTEKLQKFEKYFRRLNFQYSNSKKNLIFRFHEIFQEEMKETETGKKWKTKVYGEDKKDGIMKSKLGWGKSY